MILILLVFITLIFFLNYKNKENKIENYSNIIDEKTETTKETNTKETNIKETNIKEEKPQTRVAIFEYPDFEGKYWVLDEGEYTGEQLYCFGIPLKSIGSCALSPNTKVSFFRHRNLTGIMHDGENLTYSVINPYLNKNREIKNFIDNGWNNQTQSILVEKI